MVAILCAKWVADAISKKSIYDLAQSVLGHPFLSPDEAIEMVADKHTRVPYPAHERRGLRVYRHALTRGVILRPLGNLIYFMPPYVVTTQDIDLMVAVAREGIALATT